MPYPPFPSLSYFSPCASTDSPLIEGRTFSKTRDVSTPLRNGFVFDFLPLPSHQRFPDAERWKPLFYDGGPPNRRLFSCLRDFPPFDSGSPLAKGETEERFASLFLVLFDEACEDLVWELPLPIFLLRFDPLREFLRVSSTRDFIAFFPPATAAIMFRKSLHWSSAFPF